MVATNGYIGKILWVDLTNETSIVEDIVVQDAFDFIGGYGLGAKILFKNMESNIDPLGPYNILGLITGPLTGTEAIIGSRFMAVGKSPLTGMWCDSNAGGKFGPKLKAAGFDAVFITGAAAEKTLIYINSGEVEIQDASWLWGKDTYETEMAIKEKFGEDVDGAFIGPAGERKALTSGIVTNDARICARGGLGAVMGSKNLKGVVVKGDMPVAVADEALVKELRKKYLPHTKEGIGKLLSSYGTCGLLAGANEAGDAPVKNWAGVGIIDFPNAASIGDENVIKYQSKKYGCYKCPIACGGVLSVPDGKYKTDSAAKIEYESLGAFGTMCLNDNVESLIKINDICNRYGLDTISTGAAVAFAIECVDKDVLKPSDFDGLELKWGNTEALVKLTEMIAMGKGIGKILSNGLEKAAQQIGKGSEEWAIHIRGEALPMHDPRWGAGLATAYISDATPARHTQGSTTFAPMGLGLPPVNEDTLAGHGEAHKASVNFYHAASCAGLCLFGYFVIEADVILQFFNAVTGFNYSMDEFLAAGERIATVRHSFNIREGVFVKDLKIPKRAFGYPPLSEGPTANIKVDYALMVKDYFRSMGWDADSGVPSNSSIERLNLSELIDS